MTALTDATFYAPLKTTLVPTNGSGNPTYTRTSTKTVEDNEGVVKTLKSGAVALTGARGVVNWVSNKSEDITHASWLVTGGGTKPSANLFVCANATTAQLLQDGSVTNAVLVGQQWRFTYRVQYVDIQYVQLSGSSTQFSAGQYCNFDLVNGDYTATGCTATIEAVSAGVWDISILVTCTTAGVNGVNSIILVPSQTATRIQAFVGDGIKSLGILRAQFENVTGQAIQTAGDYVSVGVLPNPYHGLGTDGAKCFGTDSSGVAIPDATMLGAELDPTSVTNSMLHCRTIGASSTNDVSSSSKWISSITGADVVTNGAFVADTSDWTGNNTTLSLDSNRLKILSTLSGSSAYASTPMLTVIGTRYVVSIDYEVDAITGSISCQVGGTPASIALANYNMFSTIGTHTFAFTATATTTYITVRFTSASLIGEYVIVDNVTCYPAAVQVALTQTGVDGLANACSLLTAAAADATILQTITAASTPACTGWKVKRSVGTGSIYITRDGGSNWTDITSLINSSTFTLVGIENTSVTNPQVGFKIATSGDAIIVDSGRNISGPQLCEDIFTTTAAVTRAAESLTYQTASNFSDTAGTILATVKRNNWANGNGSVVGKASFGLLTSASNSGVQAADGTNTVSGAAGTPLSNRKLGMRWSGSALQAFAGKVFGTAGAYDGSFNLSTIAVMPGTQGYIRDLAIFNSSLTDAEIAEMVVSGAELSGGGSTSQSLLATTVFESSLIAAGIGDFSGVGLSFGSGLAVFEGSSSSGFNSSVNAGVDFAWSGASSISFITGASAKSVLTSEGNTAVTFEVSAIVSSLLQSGGLGNFSGVASNYAGSVLDILFESREPTHAAYLYREPNAYLSATYTVPEITATYAVPEIVAELAVPVLSATYLVPTITATY